MNLKPLKLAAAVIVLHFGNAIIAQERNTTDTVADRSEEKPKTNPDTLPEKAADDAYAEAGNSTDHEATAGTSPDEDATYKAALETLEAVAKVQKLLEDIDDLKYWENEGWSVYRVPNGRACAIGAVLNGTEAFDIAFDPFSENVEVSFSSSISTSLKDGSTQPIRLLFLTGDKLNDRWGAVTARLKVAADNARIFNVSVNGKLFLEDFAASEALGIMTPSDIVIYAISLKGSNEARNQVRKCAFERNNLNPSDPFLR